MLYVLFYYYVIGVMAANGTIKGVITEVNKLLLFFEVDKKIRIYVDVTQTYPTFPTAEESVEITRLTRFVESSIRCTGIMGPPTVYNFPTPEIYATELFWTLKKNHICDPEELLAMDRIIRKLKAEFSEAPEHRCLIKLLSVMSVLENKKSFKQIDVKFPKSLNYANATNELYSFMTYNDMCSSHVYPSENLETGSSRDQFLIGILDVDTTYGCFSLRDKTAKLVIRFKSHSHDLHKLKNTLVIIKKWTVFIEIFELANAPPLKYVLIDFEDVVVIKSFWEEANDQKFFYGKDEKMCKTQREMSTFFQINHISDVIVGYPRKPEIWIDGYISEKNPPTTGGRPVAVYVCYSNLSIAPFLKEKTVYKLMYNKPPTREHYNPELFNLKDNKQTYRIDEDAIFQETTELPLLKKEIILNDIQKIKNFITEIPGNQPFSITLNISAKKLQRNQFQTWYPKRYFLQVPYYGNIDDDHQMRLVFHERQQQEEDLYLDLYLTNRENHITPLGLIEDVIITAKNINQCKNKYLKTTAMSSFEIVEYSPKIRYSSATLSFNKLSSWQWRTATSKTPLGFWYELPLNSIVHGSFVFQAILDLVINSICRTCQKRVLAGRPCSTCKITERDLLIKLTIYVQDADSPCFKIDAGKDFFFEILGLKKEVFLFCDAFYKLEVLQVDFSQFSNFKIDSVTNDPECKEFVKELLGTIYRDVNYKLYSFVDAVCLRKPCRTPWQMIDFRIVFNNRFGVDY